MYLTLCYFLILNKWDPFLTNQSVLKYADVKGRTRLPEQIKGTCRFQDEHTYSQKIHTS